MDGQTRQGFEVSRDKNLYKIWNRLCSGSYFPPPVREKRIPKDNGHVFKELPNADWVDDIAAMVRWNVNLS